MEAVAELPPICQIPAPAVTAATILAAAAVALGQVRREEPALTVQLVAAGVVAMEREMAVRSVATAAMEDQAPNGISRMVPVEEPEAAVQAMVTTAAEVAALVAAMAAGAAAGRCR